MHESLFGHLAGQFGPKPENLATEALCYILESYPGARDTFIRFIRNMGVHPPGPLTFRTQCAGPENSIPDLVGSDPEGRRVVIAEAKFWAGLTDHQPVTYLNQLPPDSDGVLIFIAPSMRFASLWPELVSRCKTASLPIEAESVESGETKYRKIGARHLLALTSWSAVLAVILETLEAEKNQAGASDVRQLQGLCERMDSEAFLPLHSEELSPQIARRTVQFCALVNELKDALQTEGLGDWGGTGNDIKIAAQYRYLILENHVCCLGFNPDLWATKRSTPLWLWIGGDEKWKKPVPAATMAALAPLECEDPPRLIREGSSVLIPLNIPLNVEHDTVVSSLVDQVRLIAGLLRKAGSGAASSL